MKPETHPVSAGISTADSLRLRKLYGSNAIPMKKTGWLQILAHQFKSAIVLLLLIAAGISWAVQDYSGGVIILLIIVINAAVGFFQEQKAEHKLYQVSSLLKPVAMVKRDGRFSEIPREDVVQGDIVQLTPGCIAPADIELIFAEGLTVNESSLTGESLPVQKSVESSPRVNMGTVVTQGIAEGTVVAVGAKAMLGQIVNLAETGRPTNFEKEIGRLSELCIGIIVAVTVLLFVTKLLFHPSEAFSIEFLVFILAIAIGILPETLPLVATVALSTGALSLSKRGVVVRNLGAIRDFGSITVLCSDKTGTLTENSLSVGGHFALHEESFRTILAVAASIVNDVTDPFQKALATMHKGAPEHVTFVRSTPFNAETRQASFVVKTASGELIVRQGAYEVVAPLANHHDDAAYEEWIHEREARGERILALSLKTAGKEQIAALVSFVDPVRESAKHAVGKARKLGVTMKMISGDSELVSESIAKKLGILSEHESVISGHEWESATEAEKKVLASGKHVFARFFPAQKYELIRHLIDQGEIVGYMGDGVNDAPSLKLADVGIAVQNATDIAKSASDIILLKPGLDVVVQGIELGRTVFENVSKYLRETLTENLGNFLSISLLSLFIPFLPMLPIQILVTNLITDFPHLAIATDTVDSQSLRAPKRLRIRSLLTFMLILSVISSAGDMAYFWFFRSESPSAVQTGWFVFSTLAEVLSLLSVRSRGFFFQTTFPSFALGLSSVLVAGSAVVSLWIPGLRDAMKLVPIPAASLAVIFGIAAAYFLTFDFVKQWIYRRWPATY